MSRAARLGANEGKLEASEDRGWVRWARRQNIGGERQHKADRWDREMLAARCMWSCVGVCVVWIVVNARERARTRAVCETQLAETDSARACSFVRRARTGRAKTRAGTRARVRGTGVDCRVRRCARAGGW